MKPKKIMLMFYRIDIKGVSFSEDGKEFPEEYKHQEYTAKGCSAFLDVPTLQPYVCTQADGHEGPHIAHGTSRAVPLAIWKCEDVGQ